MHPYRRRGSAAVVVLLALPGSRPGAEAQTPALAVELTPLTAAALPSPLAGSPVAGPVGASVPSPEPRWPGQVSRPPGQPSPTRPPVGVAIVLTAAGSLAGAYAGAVVAGSASGEWDGAAAGAAFGSWLGAGLVGAAVTDKRSGALVGSALGLVAGAALATQVDSGAGNAGTAAFLLTHSVITVVFGNARGRPEAGP